jgi:hypothetical protein
MPHERQRLGVRDGGVFGSRVAWHGIPAGQFARTAASDPQLLTGRSACLGRVHLSPLQLGHFVKIALELTQASETRHTRHSCWGVYSADLSQMYFTFSVARRQEQR